MNQQQQNHSLKQTVKINSNLIWNNCIHRVTCNSCLDVFLLGPRQDFGSHGLNGEQENSMSEQFDVVPQTGHQANTG